MIVTAEAVGVIVASVAAAALGVLLDRKDKRDAQGKNIKEHPGSIGALRSFRRWVRDTRAKRDV